MKAELRKVINRGLYQMIEIQASFLIRTPYFNYFDKEDIEQELCLFYFEKLAKIQPEPTDSFIYKSFQNYALNMLEAKKAIKQGAFKNDSLDELADSGFEVSSKETLADFENKVAVREILEKLNSRDQTICLMVLGGATLDEITKEMQISKHTIYKVFEVIKKYFIF